MIICSSPEDRTLDSIEGSCAEHEMCVGGARSTGKWPFQLPWFSYCVSMSNFVQIADDQISTTATTAFQKSDTSAYAVEAVVTGVDNVTSLFAQSMQIQAQTYDFSFNPGAWRTLANGSSQCSKCASIDIEPIPVGTQRFKVDVVLQSATVVGLLYLASIKLP